MKNPRSRNLDRKPKAFDWISKNPERSALFLETIRTLESGYGGNFSGFVDFYPPEYRFNDTALGGYVILCARSCGSVRASFKLESGRWDRKEIIDQGGLSDFVKFIEDSDLPGFDFSYTKNRSDFNESIKASLDDSRDDRKRRLDNANPIPRKMWQKVSVYVRNPDVVAEVLIRANGVCEKCGLPAPFSRRSNGTPYLEVHHWKKLSDGGDDTVENAVALCPNCHREKHFG